MTRARGSDRGCPYPALPSASGHGGPIGYISEYSPFRCSTACSWRSRSARGPVDIVHACNPPDLLCLIRWLAPRCKHAVVFDHHYLGARMYLSRFPHGGDPLLECPDSSNGAPSPQRTQLISTNASYRASAIERGRSSIPTRVSLCAAQPTYSRFVPREPDNACAAANPIYLTYTGSDGPSDGVDDACGRYAVFARRDPDGRPIPASHVSAGDTSDNGRAR